MMLSSETTRTIRTCASRQDSVAVLQSLLVLALLNLTPLQVDAQTTARPTIAFHRWSEDWSVLADPVVPREPFDELKYIPLSTSDTRTYLYLGANVRERLEVNDAQFVIGAR